VQSVVSADKYKLSATSGGAAIDITNAGAGETLIGEMPAGLADWMLLAARHAVREPRVDLGRPRITQVELPEDFRDGLLDPYRLVLY
jgi:hypothetical protein